MKSTLTTALAGLVLALAAVRPAAAQDTYAPTPAFHINGTFDTASSTDAVVDDQQATPKTHTIGDRPVVVRVDGGLLFCCSNTGFIVGASVSAMPKNLKNIEIAGGVGLGRFAGFTLFTVTVDGLYDVHLQNSKLMPFVGAGLGIRHVDADTSAAFEIAGGVQLPVTGPHAVRVGVRFLFASGGTVTVLFGSYSF